MYVTIHNQSKLLDKYCLVTRFLVSIEKEICYLHAGGLRIIGHLTQTVPENYKWMHQSVAQKNNCILMTYYIAKL